MDIKLKNGVWGKEKYLALAKKGSLDTGHMGMKLLLEIAQGKGNILDLGCGEGTRLSLINGNGKNLTGIDISDIAIRKARAKYTGINFVSGNIEKLPFKKNAFDLVYSAFVFEHLDKPEEVLKEMARVLKKEGNILIIAPNYGAPNRASPPFRGLRIVKLIRGFKNDIISPLRDVKKLNWHRVIPIADADIYEMDWDTTIEPYLGSLSFFIKGLGMKVVKSMSCWEEEKIGANFMQRAIRFLGENNIYPFKNWGPHLVLLAEK